jgi:hypothetical protein
MVAQWVHSGAVFVLEVRQLMGIAHVEARRLRHVCFIVHRCLIISHCENHADTSEMCVWPTLDLTESK